MPAPAVYILAVVGTVAAGIAFKEFVYEPHIAPKVEQWRAEFAERRRLRRMRRQGPVAVPAMAESSQEVISQTSPDNDDNRAVELDDLANRDVLDWRSGVSRSQASTLRRRMNVPLDELNAPLPYSPLMPSNALHSSTASPITLTSADSDAEHRSASVSTFVSSPVLQSPTLFSADRPISPDPLNDPFITSSELNSSPQVTYSSPSLIPSLSLSHPVELDHEQGVELLSPPSSRPDTPFSSLSIPSHTSEYLSFVQGSELMASSPQAAFSDLGTSSSRSDSADDVLSVHSSAESEISDLSWISAGTRSR